MFLVFNLVGCPFCFSAIGELEKHNLEYINYEVSMETKESCKSLIVHLYILSDYVGEQSKKKYILGLKHSRSDLCDVVTQEVYEKKKEQRQNITFPQIFIVTKELAQAILENEYKISENVEYIGGCSDLLAKLKP